MAEDQLSIVAAPNVRLDGQIGDAAGGVEAHELKQGVHLHAAAGERLELHQAVLRVAVQDQRRVPRGRGVAHRYPDGAVGHHGDLLQQRAQHLHSAAAPRQAQEGQARFRSYHSVHSQGVVHQHTLGPAGDGQHAGRRIAAQQRRLHPQVALDLLRCGDGAAAREGPGGRRGADEELGEIRRGGVERPVRPDGDVFQGHLPRMLWKFNNIIEAPEYVHSVGRDISLYNWYRNSITGILRGGAQVISTLVAKVALVKCNG